MGLEIDILSLLEMNGDLVKVIFCVAFVAIFLIVSIFGVVDSLWQSVSNYMRSVRCNGFHSNNISGDCHDRFCPYSKQCCFYVSPPTFGQRVKAFFKGLKR